MIVSKRRLLSDDSDVRMVSVDDLWSFVDGLPRDSRGAELTISPKRLTICLRLQSVITCLHPGLAVYEWENQALKQVGRLRQNIGRLSEDSARARPRLDRKIPARNRKFVGRFMVLIPHHTGHTLLLVRALVASGGLTHPIL